MKFWVSGGLVPAEAARVSVLDHGFTVGDGVFETLKAVLDPEFGVAPFAMDRHVDRLAQSAAGMGLKAPDRDEVRTAVLAVCAANPELADGARIRVTLSSGSGPLGSDRNPGAATLAVTCAPAAPWPDASTVALSPWPRNERSALVGLKTTSYAENVLALARAKSLGAGEAVLGNLAGRLCEGTGSNVFVVRDALVSTPALATGCLAGITRALVLEWCADAGISAVEGDEPLADLASADEVFLTSSTRDVHPVERILDIDGERLWSRDVWPVTEQIAKVFAARAGESWNP